MYVCTYVQVEPDPEFPTVKFPNPEEGKSALVSSSPFVHAHAHTHTQHTHSHTRTHTHTHTAHTLAHTHAHTHARTHTHAHTHAPTHTHTRALAHTLHTHAHTHTTSINVCVSTAQLNRLPSADHSAQLVYVKYGWPGLYILTVHSWCVLDFTLLCCVASTLSTNTVLSQPRTTSCGGASRKWEARLTYRDFLSPYSHF